jgi:hypothetical protein
MRTAPPNTCGTCRHATPPPADARMPGWLRCAVEAAPWRYHAPGRACVHTPAEWSAR